MNGKRAGMSGDTQVRPVVAFDLDGTLVDTAPDLAAAMNHVLGNFGRPAVAPEAVRDMVGHGARRTIEKGLSLTGGGTDAMVDEGVPLFLAYYERHICDESRVWEHAESTLQELSRFAALAICTNKPVALAEKLIAALGWTARFEAILGSDSLAVRKPHPMHLIETVRRAGGDPACAAYVGDSMVDFETAEAADIPLVLVSFGYSDRPVNMLGTATVIDDYKELIPALQSAAPMLFESGVARA